jgi:ferrochelatase
LEAGYNSGVLGILLANTGSPEAPTRPALRRYLAQFLADRRIVNLPPFIWMPVLHAVILNTRPSRSARLYRRIWMPEGAPLVVISQRIMAGVQAELAERLPLPFEIALGMRYGNPSISTALSNLRQKGATRLLVLPLFPQYSTATTASIKDAALAEVNGWQPQPALRIVESYYAHPAYLRALVSAIQAYWSSFGRPQRLLFSFHGLPESYLRQGDPYPRQCQDTAGQAAAALGLLPGEWQAAYQSRFGPAAWLKPYTDETLRLWGAEGLSGLNVVCPGFATDCLETLDEIGHEGRLTFQQAGGGNYGYIPALNDHPNHIQALCSILMDELRLWHETAKDFKVYSTSL